MLPRIQRCQRSFVLAGLVLAGLVGYSTDVVAQGFGGGQGGGGFGGGGFGGGQGGGGLSGSRSTGTNSRSLMGARAGFRPSWVGASTAGGGVRTGGTGQFGQLGGQFGQAGGQFGQFGGQFGTGRNQFGGTATLPRVSGAAMQDTLKPLPPAVPEIRLRLEKLLAGAAASAGERQISFDFDGPMLVMRGTVPTEHEKRLAEALLFLEPGVREVRNELKVAAPGPAPPATGGSP